jgi:Fur family transcriptional regulator, peroxide stress response regulator
MKIRHHKTAQLAAILEYLKNNKHHPNILDIHKNVSKKLSTISMTTVYNTIDLLKKEGLIQELAVRQHEGRRFDSNLYPHDHLICSICNKIFDIEVNIDHSSLLNEKQKNGFDIREISIKFYGVCPDCKKNRDNNLNNWWNDTIFNYLNKKINKADTDKGKPGVIRRRKTTGPEKGQPGYRSACGVRRIGQSDDVLGKKTSISVK